MTLHFGPQLKEWRRVRRLSQLDLAGEAGISARHLSFLETGRSRPTEGMILRLAQALDLPTGAHNELFAAAGYAPRFGGSADRGLDGVEPGARRVVDLILDRHAPWPAACFNAGYDVLGGNTGFAALTARFGVGTAANLLDLVFTPGPVRAAIANWPAFAAAFLRRAEAEARFLGPRSPLARRLAALRAGGHLPEARAETGRPPPYVELALALAGVETRWITTVTTLGSAQDVLLEGIFIEQYFPADAETRRLADRLVDG